MGQPNPPGDIPLVEGLDASWNEFVGYIPEDKRAEFAPKFKERIGEFESLKPWQDLHKSGITPDQAGQALDLFTIIENNPQQVYDTIGKHLGLTKEETKEVVKVLEKTDGSNDSSELAALRQQVETMAQITLAQRNMSEQERLVAEQSEALDTEIKAIKNKYGSDVPEKEILMRMAQNDLTAEQAYQEYATLADGIRSRRPAPRILGSGGTVPTSQGIDPIKLDNKGVKSVVAQMLAHAKAERNQ
jgi:hypothetical protein